MKTKSLEQLKNNLTEQYKVWRRDGASIVEPPSSGLGSDSDIYGLGGRDGSPMQIDIGLGGAGKGGTAGKPGPKLTGKEKTGLDVKKPFPGRWHDRPSSKKQPTPDEAAARQEKLQKRKERGSAVASAALNTAAIAALLASQKDKEQEKSATPAEKVVSIDLSKSDVDSKPDGDTQSGVITSREPSTWQTEPGTSSAGTDTSTTPADKTNKSAVSTTQPSDNDKVLPAVTVTGTRDQDGDFEPTEPVTPRGSMSRKLPESSGHAYEFKVLEKYLQFVNEERDQGIDHAEYLKDPNVQKMLNLISKAEGADYDTIVGGKKKITDFSAHPNVVGLVTKQGPSKAAGKYQITKKTYDEYAPKLGIRDFSPESQDKIAVQILHDLGALKDVTQGKFKSAVEKAGNRWMSLPSTTIKQGLGPRSWDWVAKNLKDKGTDALAAVTGASAAKAEELPKTKKDSIPYISDVPVGTVVKPDWGQYKYGDHGDLTYKDGKWVSSKGTYATDPAFIKDLEKLAKSSGAKPEDSFWEKIKRTAAGELPSQVFAPKKAATKLNKAALEPGEKIVDLPLPRTGWDPETRTYSGTVEKLVAPKTPEPVPTPPSSLPVKPEKEVSSVRQEFEKEFAKQRAAKGAGDTFDWTNPVTGKSATYTTAYKTEVPQTTADKKDKEIDLNKLALNKGEEIVDTPKQARTSTNENVLINTELQDILRLAGRK